MPKALLGQSTSTQYISIATLYRKGIARADLSPGDEGSKRTNYIAEGGGENENDDDGGDDDNNNINE